MPRYVNSPRREGTLSQSKSWTISAFYLVLTVSKDPTASASVSASGSGSGRAYRSASASASRGGRELEGPEGNPRGVKSQELARPTVRTCALLSGPSIGLSFWRREALLGQRCWINRRLAQVDLYLGTVHASALAHYLVFISTVNTHLSPSPSPPPSQRSLRIASHRIASHHTIALFCSASQHRIASHRIVESRVFSSPSIKLPNSHRPATARSRRHLVSQHRIASIASSRDFPSTPPSIHPSIPPSIHQSRLTHSNRVTASSTKPTLSQSPQSRLLLSVPPCSLHLP